MSFLPDQIAAANRTMIESQLAGFSSMSNAAFDSWRKLADLNFKATKTSLEEATVICKQLLSAKDTREACSFMASLVQPTAAKVLAYNRHLANIASGVQTELANGAETQLAQAKRRASKRGEEAAKNAPAA